MSEHLPSNGVTSAPERLHPIHGWLPTLKLVSQPPLQLLADLSSLAILPWIESGANAAGRAPDEAL
ncbi:hypothetical protein BRAS3809_6820003 [Bradyrhizobium sp. STM 3809]|nr:hypothetical protein BRAS3809_6820003 [Bradyrhizobium sp. STM 3809]